MALTKVKLIADGVIDVDHLAASHGITTDNIGEGSALYYTDARVSSYLTTNSYATEGFVTTAVSNLVDAAPSTLDTLNELAAALGDDPNFATTVTNSIATKLPLAGGTLTGNLTVQGSITSSANEGKLVLNSTAANGKEYQLISIDTGNLGLYDGTAYRLWVGGNGNVGIGTTSPSVKLTVNGGVRLIGTTSADSQLDLPVTYGALRWYDGTTFRGGIGTNSWSTVGGANDLTLYLVDGNFNISNATNPFVTFDRANGRVGIGTTSPSKKLVVRQDVNGDPAILKLENKDGNSNAGAFIGFSTGYDGYATIGAKREGAENDSSLVFAPMLNESAVARMYLTSTGTLKLNSDTNPVLPSNLFISRGDQYGFHIHTQTGYTKLISSDDNLYLGTGANDTTVTIKNNNVGINTTSPSYKLEVNGDMRVHNNVRLGTDMNTSVTIGQNRNSQPASSDTKLILSGKNLEAGGTYYGDYGQLLFNATANYTGAARKWLITNGLDAYKFSIIMGDYGQVTPTIGTAGGASGGTPVLTINDGGNVGIGTTSPSEKLEVNGTIKLGGYSYIGEDLSDLDSLTIACDHTESIHFAHKNGSTYTTKMILNSSGNVGIGTTSPNAKLEVAGAITAVGGNLSTNATLYCNKGASDSIQGGSSVYLDGGSGSSYTQLQQGVGRFTIWGFNGSWGEKMTIRHSDGNVGIGTTTPDAKLEVAGRIYSAGEAGQRTYTPRHFLLGHPGNTGNFTRSINVSTDIGQSILGGIVQLIVHTWVNEHQFGLITWNNGGGGGPVTNVAYTSISSAGDLSISVALSPVDNQIDITFTNAHSNAHGWVAYVMGLF